MNLPNKLTLLRVCMIPFFVVLAKMSGFGMQLAAVAVYILACVTDALDGRGAPNGTIDIEIKVTNLWPNRLIGDARLPDDCAWDDGKKSKGYPLVKAWPDWLLRGSPSPTGRHAFSTCRLWTADDPLLESGLLGPVRLLIERTTRGGVRTASGTH
jgi:hypothetical protein